MTPARFFGVMTAVTIVGALAGCGSDDGSEVKPGAGGTSFGSGGTLVLPISGTSNGQGGGSGSTPGTLPPGFTKAEVGGYKLGQPITDQTSSGSSGAAGSGDGCGTVILAVVRDFTTDHPDFEKAIAAEKGLVAARLDEHRKPVFAPSGATTTVSGPTSFADWFSNVPSVNKPYVLEVFFAPANGTTSFQSNAFFPLDGAGFDEGQTGHNFHFTTEIHTQFRYSGGEVFNFTGDDDVWIFINDVLVVDLGGVHGAESATLDVDAQAQAAGIEKGNVYPFDMFQAERYTSESNFRADTNLEFVDCGTIVPDVPR